VHPQNILRKALLPLALVGSAFVAVPAVLASAPDPQTTNIPSLAWRGEHIRLVACDPMIAQSGASIDVIVEDWSGPNPDRAKPVVVNGSTMFFSSGSDAGLNCVRTTLASVKPGLAQVKLVVSNATGDQVLTHDFIAGWMGLNKPTIHQIAAADQTGGTGLGDPLGDGSFTAGGAAGRVQVTVTGTIPLLGNYSELGLGDHVTMPQDWAALAAMMATDADVHDMTPALRWDIHDDTVRYSDPIMDMVDSALTDPTSFYRKFLGDTSASPTIGPFDPQRANETLLSDGKLDAGDAPMPAARIDVTIAANSGAVTDISGAGSLSGADKAVAYSRDLTGAATDHNLYAPFYQQWIPATSAPSPAASGIDGKTGNNFAGFLTSGLYTNWSVAASLRTELATDTTCLLRSDPSVGPLPIMRKRPAGDQSIAVYTDEHGEAQVSYTPGTGFSFDSLAAIHNANGGCDLQGIDVLGTASISATARYPYQPVTDPAKASDAIATTVHSMFDKNLTYWAKGLGTANDVARIVLAHAQDITGIGFAAERVCFMGDQLVEGMKVFNGTTGPASAPVTIAGAGSLADPAGLHRLCSTTDANGNVAVEVYDSNKGLANVIAEFVDEGILRDIHVDFNTAGSSSATPAVTPPPVVTPVVKATFTLSVARLAGGRLTVRVNSNRARAAIRVSMFDSRSRTLRTITTWIRTNRLVKLGNVRIPAKTRTVKVRVITVR
jgi:hypothetical protein